MRHPFDGTFNQTQNWNDLSAMAVKFVSNKSRISLFPFSIERKMFTFKSLFLPFKNISMSNLSVFSMSRKELQVFKSVICRIPVNVMDGFFFGQTSSNRLLNDQSMFSHISLFPSTGMILGFNVPVSRTINFTNILGVFFRRVIKLSKLFLNFLVRLFVSGSSSPVSHSSFRPRHFNIIAGNNPSVNI